MLVAGGTLSSVMLNDAVDTTALERMIKEMYTRVALEPEGRFHFELGRAMALRLGYDQDELDAVPQPAVQSFAGVGYYFDLADLRPGERVVDLGSGSGMDSFIAAHKTGPDGQVIGVDMTVAQLAKAERLRGGRPAYSQVRFLNSSIHATGLPAGSFDVVISNGVINLAPDKFAVFREAARLLRPGGRLAIADIATDAQLPAKVTGDATLWASCIGGAIRREVLIEMIGRAGFSFGASKDNDAYQFLPGNAQAAARVYGVRSLSLLAIRRA
jgi:arsenite methyltransferase